MSPPPPLLLLSLLGVLGAWGAAAFEIVVAADGAAAALDLQLPPTGFVRAKVGARVTGLHVIRRVDLPPSCVTIELLNLPEPNASPLVGAPMFTLTPDVTPGTHQSWSNGNEHLFFVDHERGSKGNWLIGATPGVDSGYVYIEGPRYSKTPLGLESATNPWKWLLHGQWMDQQHLSARCLDEALVSSFYEAELFHPTTGAAMHTHFYLTSDTSGFLFDADDHRWVPLSDIVPILSLGEPVNLLAGDARQLVALVNAEHAPDGGWRLTLRVMPGTQHQEHSLVLAADGQLQDSQVLPLTPTQQVMHGRRMAADLRAVQRGDYVWLWHDAQLPSDPAVATRAELLVECLARTDDALVFRVFPTNRLDVMAQSVLDQTSDTLLLRVGTDDVLEATLRGSRLRVLNIVTIGRELEQFVWDFVHFKERALTAVPACFLYHAAVSMPQALVYAAELLCLLAGAKPVVMVQFSSATDAQWKFPLVQKLTRGILAARALRGDAFPVDARVFRHGTEETLVLFRTGRRHVMELLRPQFAAQALHLLPYVDAAQGALEPQWREQVYNAAWNGRALGYPAYFVQAYCDDFPNALPLEQKREAVAAAARDLDRHCADMGLELAPIRLGNDDSVSVEDRDLIFGTL